ncbi:MAG: hypothetical protein HOP35_14290 [Nitrospira sp.]|nr:hypothetical protein [Nitrospira sp.]
MFVETSTPLTIRRSSGDLRLAPGYPVDLPDEEALRLISKAHGKVRAIPPIVIEPAATNPRPIYWEAVDGRIVGPAVPECLARVGDEFWIVTTFADHLSWIRSDRLRSRKAFLEQREVREIEHVPTF